VTEHEESSELLEAALQRTRERAAQGDPTVQPARDDELEALAADFLGRVRADAPYRLRGTDRRGWIVVERGTGGDWTDVVVLADDATWRTGRKGNGDDAIDLDMRLDGPDRGRPPAAFRFMRSEFYLSLREELAKHAHWLQAPRLRESSVTGRRMDDAEETDAEQLRQVPRYLADELARVLQEDTRRADILAQRTDGEPDDPATAARQLTATVLAALRDAGMPGLRVMPAPSRRGLLGKISRPPERRAYFLDRREGSEVYSYGDYYRPQLEVWLTPEGSVEILGEGSLYIDDISRAAMVYRYAAKHGIRPLVPTALRTHSHWPEAFR